MNTIGLAPSTRRKLMWAVALAAAIFLANGLALGGGNGRCYTAEIPAQIVMPDGSEHPAGALKICMTRMHSPVEGLHHTVIDGKPIGLFRSRLDKGEELDGYTRPFFVFARRDDGALELQGLGLPASEGLTTYRMGTTRVTTKWQLAEELGNEDSEVVLLAAR